MATVAQYISKELTCVDCGQTFQFTARDQAFYAEKKFSPPKRCQPCRQQKKADRERGGRS